MRLLRVTNFKIFANVVVWIMLVGGVVFTAGFWACLMIARQEVTKEVDSKVGAQISYLSAFGAEQSDDITMLAFTYLGSGKTDSI